MHRKNKIRLGLTFLIVLVLVLIPSVVLADHPDDGGDDEENSLHRRDDPSASLAAHDELTSAFIVSDGPSAKITKNLAATAHGERLEANATTDVWSHNNYAYTGTFDNPCGGDPEAGIWIWDTHNSNKVSFVGIIPSPPGSRSNDVKVAAMNSGDILVHSNESCAGGPGGFEIYNVDDPTNPVHLAHVQTDDVSAFLRDNFGFVDFGVHNLFLFSQGSNDYVGAVVESEFGNFQIFDITDPTSPTLAGFWGAESLLFPNVDFATTTDFGGVILPADSYLFDGFGASANRFLHDITITSDGNQAYLANWDAGLVLLDISDVSNPQVVSVALDPVNGSLDGEVNSHSVWPSEDGSIVVEGEEDFSAWEGSIPPSNLTLQNLNTIPGVAVATSVGDTFEDPANQTSNAGTVTASEVEVTSGPLTGQTFSAVEFVGNNVPLGAGSVSGSFVWIGRACNGDPFVNSLSPGDIAVVRRGACFFSDKAANVAAAGGAAMVLANNQASTPWSGLRIWDYSDPENPVLASTFDTVCSASTAPGEACDPAGTYSSHNVIVETTGNKVKAYISWYSDGMLVLDVTDPYNPVEVARYFDNTAEFLSNNGGNPHDFWGVYKEPNSPWIYGSDRNGGLYVFKELGSGSAMSGNK